MPRSSLKVIALSALMVCVTGAGLAALSTPAEARVSVGIGIGGPVYGGGWGGGYYPYYSPYYYGYPGYYAAPPTVVYEQPSVTYAAPQYAPAPYAQSPYAQQPYAQPGPQSAYAPPQQLGAEQQPPEAAPVTPTSNTFKGPDGRPCREFHSTMEDGSPVDGTACQQPDGSWRTQR
jgi:hypothetical protein